MASSETDTLGPLPRTPQAGEPDGGGSDAGGPSDSVDVWAAIDVPPLPPVPVVPPLEAAKARAMAAAEAAIQAQIAASEAREAAEFEAIAIAERARLAEEAQRVEAARAAEAVAIAQATEMANAAAAVAAATALGEAHAAARDAEIAAERAIEEARVAAEEAAIEEAEEARLAAERAAAEEAAAEAAAEEAAARAAAAATETAVPAPSADDAPPSDVTEFIPLPDDHVPPQTEAADTTQFHVSPSFPPASEEEARRQRDQHGYAPAPSTPNYPAAPLPTSHFASRYARDAAAGAAASVPLAALEGRNISAWFGDHQVLDRVSLNMEAGIVTSLIGPSGCGKSTFLRILNRMHELIPSASLAGEVLLDGQDIYDPSRKLIDARKDIGMVFQKPNPFPAQSIYDNVIAGLKLTGTRASRDEKDELVESCLIKAGLWKEVKDRLRAPGAGLSGGQQQRLCIARSLAVKPRVLLMDEPCSALDPTSTRVIEETMLALVEDVTIVIVTHNMQQAQRVSKQCAFFLASQGTPGAIVEHGDTDAMFADPIDPRTFDYVNGRFG